MLAATTALAGAWARYGTAVRLSGSPAAIGSRLTAMGQLRRSYARKPVPLNQTS